MKYTIIYSTVGAFDPPTYLYYKYNSNYRKLSQKPLIYETEPSEVK